MARMMPAAVTASVRPMPTTVIQMTPSSCQSHIISSPNAIRSYRRPGLVRCDCSCIKCTTTCCTCFHVDFLRRTPGFLKLTEAILGVICQFLLLEYGTNYASRLGESYTEFLISVSSCLITTVILLGCYVLSKNSYHLIRSSIFETAFNMVACLLYLSASTYLAFAVNTKLYLDYVLIPYFQVYPALSAAYTLGFVAGVIHGTDSYLAYRYLQGR